MCVFPLFAKIQPVKLTRTILTLSLYLWLCMPAQAQGVAPMFELTAPSAWLRAAPSLAAANIAPIFKGERNPAIARSVDGDWLQLRTARGEGWLARSLGTLQADAFAQLPLGADYAAINPIGAPAAFPSYIPVLTQRARAILDAGARAGRDRNAFTVVGDCNSEPTAYLGRLAAGLYQLPTSQQFLQPTLARYNRSIGRVSLAARGGYGTAAMFDPVWADPALCRAGEGPFTCELRISNASIVLIELGTGDQFAWKTFEANYRPLLQAALDASVLPVLVTKADDLEAQDNAPSDYINGVIRRLAISYGVPLLDFSSAARALPNDGLVDEGNADFHLSPAGSDLHLLVTLQTLHSLDSGLAPPAPAPLARAPAPPPPASTPLAPLPAPSLVPSTGDVVVDAAIANLRDGPSLNSIVLGQAQFGQRFSTRARSADGAWLQIDAGRWIYAALLRPAQVLVQPAPDITPAAASDTVFVVTVPLANIRAAPSRGATLISQARAGASFPILERSTDSDWVRIGDGQWIYVG